MLTWIVVAPVTRTIRGIPTEVPLGAEEGLPTACVASFDNLQPIRPSRLTNRLGRLAPARMGEVCVALAAMADC